MPFFFTKQFDISTEVYSNYMNSLYMHLKHITFYLIHITGSNTLHSCPNVHEIILFKYRRWLTNYLKPCQRLHISLPLPKLKATRFFGEHSWYWFRTSGFLRDFPFISLVKSYIWIHVVHVHSVNDTIQRDE